MIRKILGALFIVFGICVNNTYAVENTNNQEMLFIENESSKYDIVYSDEWKRLSYNEQVCIIDSDLDGIKGLSTARLLDLFFIYPFKMDYLTYDDMCDGFYHLEKTSTVFRELINRPDFKIALFKKYEINTNKTTILERMLLEDMISYYCIEENDQENVNNKGKFINRLMATNAENTFVQSQQAHNINGTKYYEGIYTKYGTNFMCWKYFSGDIGTTQIASLISEISSTHPSWVLVNNPTKKYNCHSYAWINAAPNNVYWYPDPTSMCNSSSMIHNVGTNSAIYTNDSRVIIYAYDAAVAQTPTNVLIPAHSAIAKQTTTTGTTTTNMNNTVCFSKIGSCGVYRTTLKEIYDYYGGVYYKVYTIS